MGPDLRWARRWSTRPCLSAHSRGARIQAASKVRLNAGSFVIEETHQEPAGGLVTARAIGLGEIILRGENDEDSRCHFVYYSGNLNVECVQNCKSKSAEAELIKHKTRKVG